MCFHLGCGLSLDGGGEEDDGPTSFLRAK